MRTLTTHQQVKELVAFIQTLADQHLSPDQLELRIAHKLAILGLVQRPQHTARQAGATDNGNTPATLDISE